MRDVLILALLIVIFAVLCLVALTKRKWCKKVWKKKTSASLDSQPIGVSSKDQVDTEKNNGDGKGIVTEQFLSDWEASMRQQMQNLGVDDSKAAAHVSNGKQRRSVAELQEIAKRDQQRRMSELQMDFGDDDEDWYGDGELRRNSFSSVPNLDETPPSVGHVPKKQRHSGQALRLPTVDGYIEEKKIRSSQRRPSAQKSPRPHQSLQVPGSELDDNSDALVGISPDSETQSPSRIVQSLQIPSGVELQDVGASPQHKPKRRLPRTRHSPGPPDPDGEHVSHEAHRASSVPVPKRNSRRSALPKKPSASGSDMQNDEWPVNRF